MIKIVDKGDLPSIDCKCSYPDCTFTILQESAQLSDASTATDKDLDGFPLLTSAYRCQRHNKCIGGVDNSYHKKGLARDYTHSDLKQLKKVCEKYWDFIKVYEDKNFIHCHNKE